MQSAYGNDRVERRSQFAISEHGASQGSRRPFWNNSDGGVTILGALSLISVVGIAALSVELGQGYSTKIDYQGAADAAALAAANDYTSNKSDSMMELVAKDIARANGIAAADVLVERLNNFSSAYPNAVRVTVSTSVPLYFARIFKASTSYKVSSKAVASLSSNEVPPCVVALSPSSSGVRLTGGTSISAPACAIASNSSITLDGGAQINSKATASAGATTLGGGTRITASESITYGTTLTTPNGTSATAPTKTNKAYSYTDPLAGNTALNAAFGQLGIVTTPAVPTVPTGEDLLLNYSPATRVFQGKNGTLSNGVWTFPAGTYNIKNLDTSSTDLVIQGPSTVTVSGSVTIGGGGSLTVGDGPVSIKAPINLSGGTTLTLGAGRHYVGQINVTGGGSKITIGNGDIDVNGAINVSGGGSEVRIGSGTINVGNNGAGRAIYLSGGGYLSMGSGEFSANGSIVTDGGSTIIFGAATYHRINGDLSLNGSSTFGAGTYLIDGNFTNNTGGTMTGTDVSFVLTGSVTATGGTSIDLKAPSAGSSYGMTDLLFATRSTSPTLLGGGSQDKFSGIVYTPNSDFTMSGGASAGGCFSVLAKTVTLNGGTSAAIACPSLVTSSSSSTVVTLIQ